MSQAVVAAFFSFFFNIRRQKRFCLKCEKMPLCMGVNFLPCGYLVLKKVDAYYFFSD